MTRLREIDSTKTTPRPASGASRAAFTQRLHTIVQHWPSADRLARAMRVSPSAFRKWLRGEAEPSRERLIALADAAGVNIGWLANGDGPPPAFAAMPAGSAGDAAPETTRVIEAEGFTVLPKSPDAAAAGTGQPPPPRPDTEFIAFRNDWVRAVLGLDPRDLVMETAVGESMQPTIQNGDLLLVDTTDRNFSSFGVYVLEIAGERLVKRVQRKLDGSLVLISDNATYQPDLVDGDMLQGVTVVGRVVWGGGAI